MSQPSLMDPNSDKGLKGLRHDDDGVCVSFLCLQVLTAQDLVDFSPVYRCLHIYTILVGPRLTAHSTLAAHGHRILVTDMLCSSSTA